MAGFENLPHGAPLQREPGRNHGSASGDDLKSFGAAIIPGLGSYFGGKETAEAQEQANRANMMMNEKNNALQKQFAQMGIRWKVADAKKAGIHPLYALGAQTHSFAPSSIGASPETAKGAALAQMGQDIGGAIARLQTNTEKQYEALQLSSMQLDIEGKALDNQIRAKKLAMLGMQNPAFPGDASTNFMPGQGTQKMVVKPSERTASEAGRPAQEAGWRPSVSYGRTDTGLTPVIPESLSESMEDDFIGKLNWRLQNQIMPNFTGEGSPPKSQLPPGATHWKYSFSKQEWQPGYKHEKNLPKYPMEYLYNKGANLYQKYLMYKHTPSKARQKWFSNNRTGRR